MCVAVAVAVAVTMGTRLWTGEGTCIWVNVGGWGWLLI